ncbi:hypothetical protein BU25DRAFT_481822 [Macroventuria anomochaeta]|uniref:Uncharacterized protein n=1 Tax=Macroventuria anomochaeta TaxID=301207 RepID=A0ACB6SAU6_9PLEO|nr:uncharacterized protein BU25DRAFT_481822 [Macroventuria anomochaeta]KAF2631256.1 hypothetical protein BU25DRAFT_481822 [Macroventuria anomochaeta]
MQNFLEKFHAGGPDAAVVASRSTAQPTFSLDQDYHVQVTIYREDGTDDAAQVNTIKRTAPAAENDNDSASNIKFFTELSPNTSVTVNGRTYVNDAPTRALERNLDVDTGEAESPFYVGPLHRYIVIEVLSQPMFFFRGREDLGFTDKIAG